CPQLRFGPLPVPDLVAVLVRHGRTETEARLVAETADGSLQRALESMAGELVEGRDVAQQVLLHAAATSEPRRRADRAKDLVASTGSGSGDREQLAVHLRSMSSLLRDAELVACGADRSGLANPDVTAAIERLAETYRGARGQQAFVAVDQALAAL